MKAGVQWLLRLFGTERAPYVAEAYRLALAPDNTDGRRILSDLAHYCRVGQSSFVSGDPYQTAFNEGARDVFLHIAEMIDLAPEDFPKFIHEADHDR
jgi:hypothetical protein